MIKYDMVLTMRKKIAISISSKGLELVDEFAKTTGFESRSRVIEEAIFSINDLLKNEDLLVSILDRFRRFPLDEENPEITPIKYRRVPPEKRKQKQK